MNISLKVISLLLSYPTEELLQAMPELKAALADDAAIGEREKALLDMLADDIAGLDLYDAQERYVFLFDRTRSLSLHLFEHVHGESRDRGQAMVDLMTMYEAQGFEIGAKELPDYLPMFLEFLSTRPEEEARELLGQTVHIISALRERLHKRKSIYINAFRVLEAIARGKADPAVVAEILKKPDDNPDDLAALDRIWEEEAVTFGGGAGNNACGADRIRTQIRAAQR
ncbi:MAG: nitrate reductase molybdenum cofactor assembly chaperone, partial [Rhodomicrobiaceae bacterium]